jgi:hypothetical protein
LPAPPTATFTLAATPTPTPGPLSITVSDTGATVEVQGGASRAVVAKDPFHLTLVPADGPQVEEAASGLYFTAGGQQVSLDRVEATSATATQLQLTVASSAGTTTVELSFPRAGVIRVALTPPAGITASPAGERFASPSDERVYGLLERTVSDRTASELVPQEVGSLDRRGTKVDLSVQPSMALYTPFFQTSRGYGIFVEGTALATTIWQPPNRKSLRCGSSCRRASIPSATCASVAPITINSSIATRPSPVARLSPPSGRSSTGAGVTSTGKPRRPHWTVSR